MPTIHYPLFAAGYRLFGFAWGLYLDGAVAVEVDVAGHFCFDAVGTDDVGHVDAGGAFDDVEALLDDGGHSAADAGTVSPSSFSVWFAATAGACVIISGLQLGELLLLAVVGG